MNLFNCTGKIAVVTSGNRGIGPGMPDGIATLGANIVITGRARER
jgi:2-dehydro-3-deoxy-D-gluconate 5-dehydrogenase